MQRKEFSIGQFQIDMLRNQVTSVQATKIMEPKILQVLLVLAEHQGEVVSYEEISDKVWPNSVNTQNQLQRAITQLRKVLGDDSKTQSVIKTHAKKGYSLLPTVEWTKNRSNNHSTNFSLGKGVISIAGLLALFTLVFMIKSNISEPIKFYDKLTPLTSTDNSEFFSSFSPNGRYVVFTRHESLEQANLWMKDLETNQETQISWEKGHAVEPIWSPDGERLAFINDSEENGIPSSAIYSLYMPLAKLEKQQATHVIDCQFAFCNSVQWISNEDLVFISQNDNGRLISKHDLNNNTTSPVYQVSGNHIYSMSYSDKRNQIAVMMLNQYMKHELFILNLDDNSTTPIPFSLNKGNDYWFRWNVKWNADHDGFIIATDSRLLHMSFEGDVIEQQIPTYKYVMWPEFRPGKDQLALTLGYQDIDVKEVSLKQANDEYKVINRSFRQETNAKYQPKGNGIAFVSDRSGNMQLWLQKDEQTVQLSHLNKKEKIVNYVWSPDGKKIAIMVNEDIYLSDLAGGLNKLNLSLYPVKLFQWLPNNTLLVSVINGTEQNVLEIDIESSQQRLLYNGTITWAQKKENNQIIALTNQGQLASINDQKLDLLDSRNHNIAKRFYHRGGKLYWANNKSQVWEYSLEDKQAKHLYSAPNSDWRFSDINLETDTALFRNTVAVNKEVVLLHH